MNRIKYITYSLLLALALLMGVDSFGHPADGAGPRANPGSSISKAYPIGPTFKLPIDVGSGLHSETACKLCGGHFGHSVGFSKSPSLALYFVIGSLLTFSRQIIHTGHTPDGLIRPPRARA